jgi:hypothetical protein
MCVACLPSLISQSFVAYLSGLRASTTCILYSAILEQSPTILRVVLSWHHVVLTFAFTASIPLCLHPSLPQQHTCILVLSWTLAQMPEIEFFSNELPLSAQFNERIKPFTCLCLWVHRRRKGIFINEHGFEVCVCLRSSLVLSHKQLGSGQALKVCQPHTMTHGTGGEI